MAIESFKVGPGVLTLDTGAQVASAQILSASVVPAEKVKETDPEPVLSGEELPGSSSASLTYRLKGKVLQDGSAAGLVAFSWDEAGNEVTFTYTPNTGESPSVTGTVRVVPFTIGGDVSLTDRAKADFDWSIIGVPVPTFIP
jgi:hypothetical protein